MRIIKQIDEETFVISLKDYNREKYTERIEVAHDYVRFSGYDTLSLQNAQHKNIFGRHAFAANCICIPTEVQIGIKAMHEVVIPQLMKHKYMQPEHLNDRIHPETDKYWDADHNKEKGITQPRWVKGDSYPAYADTTDIIHYRTDTENMVAFRRAKERNFTHVTLGIYNEFIKGNL